MENKSGSMNEKMVSQEHDTERTINKKLKLPTPIRCVVH